LKNVFTLRNVNDALRLKEPTKNAKNIVVIGASFIGLETAGTIKNELKDKVNITVVDSNKVAFEKSLGKEIGQV
jgi:NADPH-dependent 2,4-dienoyl-CoA reductase/sulfur reductase-like enzyme